MADVGAAHHRQGGRDARARGGSGELEGGEALSERLIELLAQTRAHGAATTASTCAPSRP